MTVAFYLKYLIHTEFICDTEKGLVSLGLAGKIVKNKEGRIRTNQKEKYIYGLTFTKVSQKLLILCFGWVVISAIVKNK